MGIGENILFVFSHQDDEYAILSRISWEWRQGHTVYCVYLTDGAGNNSDPQVRNEESRRVLTRLGVPSKNIWFLGVMHAIPDGRLMNHLDKGLNLLDQCMEGIPVFKIYCLSWEGGHPDHDASHVIALAFAKKSQLLDQTWEFAFYHGHKTLGKLFRTLSPLEIGIRKQTRKFGVTEGLKLAFACWQYRSQRKTWLGLFPEAFFKLVVLRREIVQLVDIRRILDKPHPGPLLYERKFHISYGECEQLLRPFIRSRLRLPIMDAEKKPAVFDETVSKKVVGK